MRGISMRNANRNKSHIRAASGQATVEFGIASVVFFMIVFGTVDFGRSIFLNAQLHSAVRDAAREGNVGSANGYRVNKTTLKTRIANAWNSESRTTKPRPGLTNVTVTVECIGRGGCISPLTLTASSSVVLE